MGVIKGSFNCSLYHSLLQLSNQTMVKQQTNRNFSVDRQNIEPGYNRFLPYREINF